MPEFENLPQAIQTAWEAAVRQAYALRDYPVTADFDEQRWAGWIPPHLRQV
jgi:hypothetical protein